MCNVCSLWDLLLFVTNSKVSNENVMKFIHNICSIELDIVCLDMEILTLTVSVGEEVSYIVEYFQN